jgi:hypothetical protein
MKTLTKTILIILLFAGCESKSGVNQTELSILIDGTDSTIDKPKFEDFEPLISLGSNNDGVKFKVQMIGDIDLGSSFEVKIPAKGNDDETDEQRYLRKSKFIKDCKVGYDLIKSKAVLKDFSIVYRVVVNELNRLAKSQANEKLLVITSDLMEKSDYYNIYKEHDKNLLLESPEDVKNFFVKQVRIDSLNGVNVIFTYEPVDFEQNKIYMTMLKIYTELITESGGRCRAGSI